MCWVCFFYVQICLKPVSLVSCLVGLFFSGVMIRPDLSNWVQFSFDLKDCQAGKKTNILQILRLEENHIMACVFWLVTSYVLCKLHTFAKIWIIWLERMTKMVLWQRFNMCQDIDCHQVMVYRTLSYRRAIACYLCLMMFLLGKP